MDLKDLRQHIIFKYFEEISKIPHGSGNERAISDYLTLFGKNRNLDVIQDSALNVIIKKPATPGYEDVPTVILQGHMDMVCEKNRDSNHNFQRDPLQLRIIEDMIYGTETTLGADNGIAIAYGLALLEAKGIPHPALEILFTTQEETTMEGALEVDPKYFNGRILINLDCEEEGKLLVSSAGGVITKQILPIYWEDAKDDGIAYTISIKGLKGGHSGMEIHKGRGNPNKLMGRLLNDLNSEIPYRLAGIDGGSKVNAIPREAETHILIESHYTDTLKNKINGWAEVFKNELRTSDPNVAVTIEKCKNSITKVFSKDTQDKAVASLIMIPNGVQTMSMDIEGLVESSTNLGVVTTEASTLTFVSEIRSAVKTLKTNILTQAEMVAKFCGSQLIAESDYPEWSYSPDSKIRSLFEEVYYKKFGKNPEIIAYHAGIESGILMNKIPGLDAISIGPQIYDVHTPNEHISISSTEKTWDYLIEVLKEIKNL